MKNELLKIAEDYAGFLELFEDEETKVRLVETLARIESAKRIEYSEQERQIHHMNKLFRKNGEYFEELQTCRIELVKAKADFVRCEMAYDMLLEAIDLLHGRSHRHRLLTIARKLLDALPSSTETETQSKDTETTE